MTQRPPALGHPALVYSAMLAAAQRHCEAGRLSEARQLVEWVLQAEPQNAKARHQLGLVRLEQGEADGVSDLLDAIRGDPMNPDRQADLGDACDRLGDAAAASLCHRRALALAPGWEDLLLRFGELHARHDRSPMAELWMRRSLGVRKAFGRGYVALGDALTAAGRVADAIKTYHRGAAADPQYGDAFRALAFGLNGIGAPIDKVMVALRMAAERMPHDVHVVAPVVQHLRDIGAEAEAERLARPLIERQMANVAEDEIGRYGFRILMWEQLLPRIGEFAFQLDLYVKMQKLGWQPPHIPLLLAPRDHVVNASYLDCWRPHVAVVEEPEAIERLTPLAERLAFNSVYIRMPDGRTLSKNRVFFAVQEEWQRQGRGPLLDLGRRHVERGRAALREFGMPDEAWFVCVHVRESGYMRENPGSSEATRNADIRSYFPAIEEIAKRGGWVVRLGDPTMMPLPPMAQVIDYAHSALRSDWMDVYLSASCRFMLSTTSGMSVVASTFGVPVGAANFFPAGERLHSERDVFIPKLHRDRDTGRLLSFEECLAMPLALTYDATRLETLGLEVLDNDAQDVHDLALEMLARAEGSAVYDAEDQALQRRWNELSRAFSAGDVGSRVGRGFLARYRHLFQSM
jgi:putative glycosyltransferase (TIGR04372 family)